MFDWLQDLINGITDAIIECVVVESKEEIKVIFIGGLETTERLRTDCAE